MEQGSVLRHKGMLGTSIGVRGLNPFGTGQCLTTKELKMAKVINLSLNPFGTGQCLTTSQKIQDIILREVSIPLEQGSVLRQMEIIYV